jgi:hypothetical protein
MLSFLMPAEVSSNFMFSLLDGFMGAERLLQSLSLRLRPTSPERTTAFLLALSHLLSLSVLHTKVFRSLIVCKTFYYLDLAQNFS